MESILQVNVNADREFKQLTANLKVSFEIPAPFLCLFDRFADRISLVTNRDLHPPCLLILSLRVILLILIPFLLLCLYLLFLLLLLHRLLKALSILLIDLHQGRLALFLQHVGIDYKSGYEDQFLRLAGVVADLVMTARRLVPRVARLDQRGWLVVHFVVGVAFDYVAGQRGLAVAVRRGGAVRGEGDEQCGDGFSGDIGEGELVEGLESGDRSAAVGGGRLERRGWQVGLDLGFGVWGFPKLENGKVCRLRKSSRYICGDGDEDGDGGEV